MRCSNRLRPYCNFVNSRISRIIPEVRKPKKLAANRKRDYNDKLESSNFEGCGYEILWLTDQILPTRPKKKLFVVVSLMFSRQAGIDRHRHIPGLKRIRCCFRAGRARWKDYFRTTLSYPDTIRLDMGLTYDRIFAPISNTVLESFTAPEQRTRARASRQQMAECEINMLVTRDLSENTCANRLTANRNRALKFHATHLHGFFFLGAESRNGLRSN